MGDQVPAYIRKAFRAGEPAWTNFRKLAPSRRRLFVFWIEQAKREETRLKRIGEAIRHLCANTTPDRWVRTK